MSDSPFLAQGSSSRRARAAARRRRRRRRRLTAAAIAIVIAAVAVVLALSRSDLTHGSTSAATRSSGHKHSPAHPLPPTRSPAGLPLGRPPLNFDLSAGNDPVQIAFRHPPRAGLLFDLSSGRVLWQRNPLEHLHIASLTKMMTALRVVRADPPDAPVRDRKSVV